MDLGHVRFQVLERFNSYARREDVDVSQLLHFGVWAAPHAWGYPSGQAGVGAAVRGQLAAPRPRGLAGLHAAARDRKSTRLNSSHRQISYAGLCLEKKKAQTLTAERCAHG